MFPLKCQSSSAIKFNNFGLSNQYDILFVSKSYFSSQTKIVNVIIGETSI